MFRLQLISCIVALCLVIDGSISYAQERSVGPYFGVSGSLDTNGNPGWGTEAGIHFLPYYAGLEFGTYAYRPQRALTIDPTIGSLPSPYPISTEQFWGVHAGYVFSDKYYVGFVVLKSSETWKITTSEFSGYTISKSYLNIGPDLRYAGFDDGHIYLGLALTIRRGIKAGLGYVF